MSDVERTFLPDLSRRIGGIPLFQNVGRPINDMGNQRIYAWDAWPGPDEQGSQVIAVRQQHLHDKLVPLDAEELWQSALQVVVDHVAKLIPYDADEDIWHAPTAAAWNAAWTFALECLHGSLDLPLSAELRSQITWYELGHWPCLIKKGRSGRDMSDYVIF